MGAREQWLTRDSPQFASHYNGSPLARYPVILDVILIDSMVTVFFVIIAICKTNIISRSNNIFTSQIRSQATG